MTTPRKRTGIDFLIGDDEPEQPTFNQNIEVGKKAVTSKIPAIKDEETELTHEIRVTLQMPFELHQKIKIMAHWELSSLKNVINEALTKTVAEYEDTHGQLVAKPKSEK